MFGKRSTSAGAPPARPVAPAAPPRSRTAASPPPPSPEAKPAAAPAGVGQAPAKSERKPVERPRSEEYYDVKTTVFHALIDTIDLTQLSKLDPETARE